MSVARCSDVSVTGNIFTDNSDCSLLIISDADGTSVSKITVSGNTLVAPANQVPLMAVGYTTPVSEGYPEDIVITGNNFNASGTDIDCFRLYCGKRITFADNILTNEGVTALANMVELDRKSVV